MDIEKLFNELKKIKLGKKEKKQMKKQLLNYIKQNKKHAR